MIVSLTSDLNNTDVTLGIHFVDRTRYALRYSSQKMVTLIEEHQMKDVVYALNE